MRAGEAAGARGAGAGAPRGTVAVAVMAKVPVPGEVKTRLCPPLAPAEAAALARAFLQDRVEALGGLPEVAPLVAFTPPGGARELAALLPARVPLRPQEGPDLGARLDRLLTALLGEGYAGAVALDADSPTLPTAYIAEGCQALRDGRADVVIGPAEDGGYYLIGLGTPAPGLFTAMPWSTPGVLPETVARARRLGLRLWLLPPWYDVDRAEDLARLRRERDHPGAGHRPPRTLACLTALDPPPSTA